MGLKSSNFTHFLTKRRPLSPDSKHTRLAIMNPVLPQSRGDGTNKRVTIAMAATGNPVCTVFVSDCLILIASRYQDQWYRVRAASANWNCSKRHQRLHDSFHLGTGIGIHE